MVTNLNKTDRYIMDRAIKAVASANRSVKRADDGWGSVDGAKRYAEAHEDINSMFTFIDADNEIYKAQNAMKMAKYAVTKAKYTALCRELRLKYPQTMRLVEKKG